MTDKSLTPFILEKIKVNENQLINHDLGCQNIFGQNKGQQR